MKQQDKEENFDKYYKKLAQFEHKKQDNQFVVENRYLYSLLEITHSISVPQHFNELLELIVDSAITLTKAERGFLMLFGNDGNLEFRVTRNFDRKTLEEEEFKISRTVVNHVLANGKALFLSDIYKNKKFKVSQSIEALGLRMVMCVPLKAKNTILGVIYVDSHAKIERFTRLEEKMFEAFATQASVAIENSRLYDSSVHDSLTGLYNYGYLRARLEEEMTRGKKGTLCFMMLDLDNFKPINDSHGHLVGNSILIKVADLIKKRVRKCDIAVRYGGDEFAVLMPNTEVGEARRFAMKLQKEMAQLTFSMGKETISVSSSIGISSFPVEKITDGENIIVEADHALFIAKSKGGNQIAVFGLRPDYKKPESEFISRSHAIDQVKEMIVKLAKTDATILITGETGTGKELVTKMIHEESARVHKPFVVVNCSAIPDNLLESELFGYEKGAFTGAYRQHKGKFEIAQGGTIFLDEIGELPLHLQVKILRAIEQKEIDRIGGKSPIKVDIRVIAATNKNLEEEVDHGNFRKDLFYRLNVATIYLPPFRERPEDIEVLSKYYLKKMNETYHRKFLGFTKGGMEAMMHHPWPGNIRELIHRIERAVIMGMEQYLDENDLGLVVPKYTRTKTLSESREEAEKKVIIDVLIHNRWNLTRSARELNTTPKTVKRLLKKYRIVRPS